MKMFDSGKTRMIALPYGEKTYNDMLSRFHLIPERYGRTDGQTDRQTDRFSISISHVSMLTRDKNSSSYINYSTRELFFVTLSYTRARCNYGHRLKHVFVAQ